MSGNTIGDMTPIANLENLRELQIYWAQVSDPTPLHSMTQLESLNIGGLDITDIGFRQAFENLNYLNADTNQITSLAPLVANTGLGAGDFVDVRNNPLDLADPSVQAQIDALLARGVDLRYE